MCLIRLAADLEIAGLRKHLDGCCPILFNEVCAKPGPVLSLVLTGR